MENNELLRRAEDLAERCRRTGEITNTRFLTPAESYELAAWAKYGCDCTVIFNGGGEGCERTAAFFIPDWMSEDDFDPAEYIKAIRIKAYFGQPGHRDYMGALLNMGVNREWIGDIRVKDSEAEIFCMKSVSGHLQGLEKVGRCGVKCEEVALDAIKTPEKQVKQISFSVMSPRLDAVVGGMFNLSRTESAKHIGLGNVSVNYKVSYKTDLQVKEGDIISLRGSGKGTVTGTGGTSRKGRTFMYAEIFK